MEVSKSRPGSVVGFEAESVGEGVDVLSLGHSEERVVKYTPEIGIG